MNLMMGIMYYIYKVLTDRNEVKLAEIFKNESSICKQPKDYPYWGTRVFKAAMVAIQVKNIPCNWVYTIGCMMIYTVEE